MLQQTSKAHFRVHFLCRPTLPAGCSQPRIFMQRTRLIVHGAILAAEDCLLLCCLCSKIHRTVGHGPATTDVCSLLYRVVMQRLLLKIADRLGS